MHQGKILQYTPQGTGLISSNGVKYEFTVYDHWFSPIVPKKEDVVSFTLDSNGKLAKIYAGEPTSALPIGVVLKDGQVGNGLVICEGKKYPFSLAKEWGSDEAPKENSRVYVETDDHGHLIKLTLAPQSRFGNLNLPGSLGNLNLPSGAGDLLKNLPPHQEFLSRIPVANVILFVAMVFSWYVLNAVTIPQGQLSLTIGQALSIVGAGGAQGLILNQTTYLNVIGWIALLLIFLPTVWRSPAARLGVFAPFALLVILSIAGYSQAMSALNEIRALVGDRFVKKMLSEAISSNIFSFGLWLSIALSTVGAFICLLKSKPTVADLLAKHGGNSSMGYTPQPQPPVAQPPAPMAAAPQPECPSCHEAVGASDAFCTGCGKPLK